MKYILDNLIGGTQSPLPSIKHNMNILRTNVPEDVPENVPNHQQVEDFIEKGTEKISDLDSLEQLKKSPISKYIFNLNNYIIDGSYIVRGVVDILGDINFGTYFDLSDDEKFKKNMNLLGGSLNKLKENYADQLSLLLVPSGDDDEEPDGTEVIYSEETLQLFIDNTDYKFTKEQQSLEPLDKYKILLNNVIYKGIATLFREKVVLPIYNEIAEVDEKNSLISKIDEHKENLYKELMEENYDEELTFDDDLQTIIETEAKPEAKAEVEAEEYIIIAVAVNAAKPVEGGEPVDPVGGGKRGEAATDAAGADGHHGGGYPYYEGW